MKVNGNKQNNKKRENQNQIMALYFTSFYHHQAMKRKVRNYPKVRLQQQPDLEDIKKKNQFEKIAMTQYRSDGKIKENGCLMKKEYIFCSFLFLNFLINQKIRKKI
jgi:hypothetical protein